MSRLLPVILLVAVLPLVPSPLPAQVDPVAEPDPVGVAAPALTPAAPVVKSPLMREITAAWEAHEVVVEALEQQLNVTTDATAALALQRQIEAARAQVELEILAIQARHARQEGRLDVAAELETAIGLLTTPPARGVPVPRVREAD